MAATKQINTRFYSVTLIALLVATLVSANTHAQSQCPEIFGQSAGRTEIRNAFLTENKFTIDRDLSNYSQHFPFKYTQSVQETVEQLPAGSIWVDMGAGRARALIDGLKANPRISEGVAIAYKRPPTAFNGDDVPGRFRYLEGDYVENMGKDGKLDSLRGRVHLITDVFGPLSYSEHLPPLLQTYFDLLRPDGTAVFNIMAERNFDNTSPTAGTRILAEPMLLNPALQNGRYAPEGVIAWLRTIPGIEVVEVTEAKAEGGAYWEKSFGLKIRKVSKDVVVPNTLRTRSYVASNPPKRVFEIVADQARANIVPLRRTEDLTNLVLQTQRLEIRALDITKAEEAAAVWMDPKTMEMSGDYLDKATVVQLLGMGRTKLADVKDSRRPFINFGIYKDGELIGLSQVAAGQEDTIYASGVGQRNQKWASISYHLKSSAWSQGIATEAASRLVRFAFENLNVDGLHAEAITSNTGSQNVIRKLGFNDLNYQAPGHVHFYIDKAAYMATQTALPRAAGQ